MEFSILRLDRGLRQRWREIHFSKREKAGSVCLLFDGRVRGMLKSIVGGGGPVWIPTLAAMIGVSFLLTLTRSRRAGACCNGESAPVAGSWRQGHREQETVDDYGGGGACPSSLVRLTHGDVPSQRAVRQAVAPPAELQASPGYVAYVLARPMDTLHRCRDSCRLFRCRLLAAVGIVAWAEDAAPTRSSVLRLLMVSTVVCKRSIEILLLQRYEG